MVWKIAKKEFVLNLMTFPLCCRNNTLQCSDGYVCAVFGKENGPRIVARQEAATKQ